jgi:mxaA protein
MSRFGMALMAVALLAAPAALAQAAAPRLAISDTRPFGYFLGDVVERTVTLRAAPGETLDTASLPQPGPLNYWLEIASVDLQTDEEGSATVYRLRLLYQTFYAPLDTRRLLVPGFKLKLSGAQDAEVTVPEFGFVTSPIRQLFSEKGQSSDTATTLRPDVMPPRVATARERTAMLLAGILLTASLAALAWHHAWWPFRQRPSRPFTDAARYLSRNRERLHGAGGYRTALMKLHRAFDAAAGRRVLSDDVAEFLAAHPEFADYRPDIERLFTSSRQAFYANDVEEAQASMPLTDLARLGAGLGSAERRAA